MSDPVTLTVAAALAIGAAADRADTGNVALADAYLALKRLVTRRYRGVDLEIVEHRPESESRRAVLAEELADHGAGDDHELRSAALLLIETARQSSDKLGAAVGVDLEQVVAAGLPIADIEPTSTGVRFSDGRFSGDIQIHNIRAGTSE
ncbi:hypothetical protein IU450_38380 [Nocardia abscessus]|uniref:hypothetical protein n=1 Tax=Nocardia abscessus TaxID=120957 RepID=UPI001894C672|nr:hypothetical protein [Nocardia abscessus]MBF6341705.1 hypothetical protein [Nocardia abscessus]